jgi:hypothetical protein
VSRGQTTPLFWRFFKVLRKFSFFFFDFFDFFYLHPRCWHLRKGAAAEAVLLCEEVLEVAPKGGSHFARGLGGGGKWVAAEVVASLEEALDGVSGGKCGSGGRHFYFLVLCQRSPRIYGLSRTRIK